MKVTLQGHGRDPRGMAPWSGLEDSLDSLGPPWTSSGSHVSQRLSRKPVSQAQQPS